jgi:hypothetical protein
MFLRSLVVWFAILVLAVLNGAARDTWLSPALGDTVGRALSSITLSGLVFVTTFITIRWLGPATARQAWGIGALWVGLTLAFEFLTGHYAFRKSCPELLADYDILRGRIWILVLVVTLLSPTWTARLRHLLGR